MNVRFPVRPNDGTMPLPEPPGGLRSWRRRLVLDEPSRPVQEVVGAWGSFRLYARAPLKVIWHDNERLARFAGGGKR